ncbi:MAG: amidohydrolase family protein [Arenimonas sp.]|uniref:amidohydrolase family protein n=1 Tax=Arenimonas sp. TaxID=1872635 RepID=UPI0025C10542|nr:amidohydrolase family protein [Arenimonas sp.]MBW8368867.1 amidohydrolase family protein [Arenimonas sp.]
MNRLQAVLAVAVGVLVLALVAMPDPAAPPAAPAPKASAREFVVRDVRLFDGERFHDRQSVHVRDGRIVAVGESIPLAKGVAVVEGAGRTLLPGLVDAHVHTWDAARRDALRFGVTTMLDMFSDPVTLGSARTQRESPDPTDRADLWSAGTLATAAGGHGTQFGMAIPTLASADEAPAWVDARIAEGSDFIKIVREDLHVYRDGENLPTLDAATAAALVAAAHARGRLAVVHASAQEAARESLRDGADGLVHVFQDVPADAAFVALARERGAFVVPTLTVVAGFSGEHSRLAEDPRVSQWLSGDQRQSLAGRAGFAAANPALLRNAMESVRRLNAAGVPILAGTDAPNPDTAHGVSLHEEMAWLAKAGLSPAQALAAATSVPADAFGLRDRGRIAPGQRADLLLVEGDPSTDLGQTLAIVTVWKNGREVDRRVATEVVPALAAGIVSHFDAGGLGSRLGGQWIATTDRMIGGQSDAALARIEGGAQGSAGALQVRGRLQGGGGTVWAGAFLGLGEGGMSPLDASGLGELVFHARGDGRTLSVLLFSGGEGASPASVSVAPDARWQEFRVRLSDVPGADPSRLRAIAITVPSGQGDFTFDLDQVEFR